MACAIDLIVAKMRATREFRAVVFISRTWVDGFCTCRSSKSVTAVTLERVDTVVTDGVVILACTRISAIAVQDTVIFVYFASRSNEPWDTIADDTTNVVCAFALVEAPVMRLQCVMSDRRNSSQMVRCECKVNATYGVTRQSSGFTHCAPGGK